MLGLAAAVGVKRCRFLHVFLERDQMRRGTIGGCYKMNGA